MQSNSCAQQHSVPSWTIVAAAPFLSPVYGPTGEGTLGWEAPADVKLTRHARVGPRNQCVNQAKQSDSVHPDDRAVEEQCRRATLKNTRWQGLERTAAISVTPATLRFFEMAGVGCNRCHQCHTCDAPDFLRWQRLERTLPSMSLLRRSRFFEVAGGVERYCAISACTGDTSIQKTRSDLQSAANAAKMGSDVVYETFLESVFRGNEPGSGPRNVHLRSLQVHHQACRLSSAGISLMARIGVPMPNMQTDLKSHSWILASRTALRKQ